jgi:plasmid stability protein
MDLSIKGVPDSLAEALRRRAEEHHRSLDEEAIDILKSGVAETQALTPAEFVAEVRAMGVQTPGEATTMIREDRDARRRY